MTVPDFIVTTGALAFTLVALLTEVMRRFAIRHRLLDQPRGDGRHSQATPYLGGLAIASGTVVAFAIATPVRHAQTLTIVGTAVIVCILGLTDDLRPVTPALRMIVECLCASALVAIGVHADVFAGAGILGRCVDDAGTVAWVVVLTNSFNLLDNMDGAAAAIALSTSPFLALLALATGRHDLAVLLIAVAAGCAGFSGTQLGTGPDLHGRLRVAIPRVGARHLRHDDLRGWKRWDPRSPDRCCLRAAAADVRSGSGHLHCHRVAVAGRPTVDPGRG